MAGSRALSISALKVCEGCSVLSKVQVGRDDFYHLYDAKLNRCVFNDSQGHDCVFFLKKKWAQITGTKSVRGEVWSGTKISTRYKSTLSLLRDSRQDASPTWRKVHFLLTVSMSDGDQENAIFTDKTHLLNQEEGRERVGGSEA